MTSTFKHAIRRIRNSHFTFIPRQNGSIQFMIDTMVECATTCRRLTRVFQYKVSFYPCSHKFESYLPCQKLSVDLLQNIFSLIKTDRVEFQSKVWHWRNRTEKHQNFKNHIEWYVVINWNLCSCQLNKLATCYLLPATVASVSQRCYMLGEYQAANYHEGTLRWIKTGRRRIYCNSMKDFHELYENEVNES